MQQLLLLIAAAVVGGLVAPLMAANAETRRHDRQVAELDEDLEEWLVIRHRQYRQRLNELRQDRAKMGADGGGAALQGRRATRVIALYDYREHRRQAEASRQRIAAEEGRPQAFVRRLTHRPFPVLYTPARARPLLEHWLQDTDGNALTWSLDDIVAELAENRPPPPAAPHGEHPQRG